MVLIQGSSYMDGSSLLQMKVVTTISFLTCTKEETHKTPAITFTLMPTLKKKKTFRWISWINHPNWLFKKKLPFCFRKRTCFRLSATYSISTSHPKSSTSRAMMSWSEMTELQHSSSFKTQIKGFQETNERCALKPPMTPLPEHLGCSWAVPSVSRFYSDWLVASTYLSMESTISSMHPLILFWASKWVMCSVDSPSMAKIMSPIHKLAWAALLPGVTYKKNNRILTYTIGNMSKAA